MRTRRQGRRKLSSTRSCLRREHGIRRTAHAGEWAIPRNVRTSLELLGCERLDHAYRLVDDAQLLASVADRGIHVATCWSTTLYFDWENSAQNPIAQMKAGRDQRVVEYG